MAYVEMGNIYYFIYIGIALLLTVLSVAFLKNKSHNFRHWFIFGLIMLGFVIHFLKIFIYPYTTVDYIFTKVSFENICAVSTLVFPFIYFSKNKTLKDYMVMVGMASGILTLLFPVDAMSAYFNGVIIGQRGAFQIEVIRFYLAHTLLFLSPFLMMRFKMHELSIHRAYRAPLMLILVLCVIFINELILTALHWVPKEDLFNPDKRNPSFIFGIRGDLTGLGAVIGIFVPYFMRLTTATSTQMWPVVWLILPALVYGGLITLIFMFIYDKQETIVFFKHILKLDTDHGKKADLPE